MKTALFVLGSVALMVAAGCGSQGQSSATQKSISPVTSSAPPPPPPPPQAVPAPPPPPAPTGTAWQTSLATANAAVLVVDPSAPSTVYAGTTQGVLKTMDSGVTWAPATSGLSFASVSALAIDPRNTGTLYAA